MCVSGLLVKRLVVYVCEWVANEEAGGVCGLLMKRLVVCVCC